MKINGKIKIKTNTGITLIALVVTIIVLLILAGISIQMLTGDNGILTRAGEAKENTEQSQLEEQRRLASMEAATNLTETIYNDGEKEIKIPSGFAPTGIEGERTVEEGLVITDSKGNEFVWIEVPNDGTGPDYPENVTDTQIETALRTYVSDSDIIKSVESGTDYKTTTVGWKDEWYNGCGLSESEYNTLKSKMLSSIKDNGGFWIGRYEAGITFPRKSNNDSIDGLKPQSKQDLYPINYVTISQAQTIASRAKNEGTYNSSLLFGIQWDLVLKFIKVKENLSENSLLTGDSSSWGNYKLEYKLNQSSEHGYRGIYSSTDKIITWSTIESGYTHNGTDSISLSTGATKRNSKRNIYDLAGNMFEWTLEHSTYTFAGLRN